MGILDNPIIFLYNNEVSIRKISNTIKKQYDLDPSASLINNLTG